MHPDIQHLLKTAKYLHLGTSANDIPHVNLMNYTYLEQGEANPYESDACIVLTTQRDTHKFKNISANGNVSLLVHDWVTAKATEGAGEGSLSQMLQNLNQSEISSLSATLCGKARIVEDPEQVNFFKQKHMATTDKCFVDEAAVIVVTVSEATLADVQNHVRKMSV